MAGVVRIELTSLVLETKAHPVYQTPNYDQAIPQNLKFCALYELEISIGSYGIPLRLELRTPCLRGKYSNQIELRRYIGVLEEDRTLDPVIKSHVLYLLSYQHKFSGLR